MALYRASQVLSSEVDFLPSCDLTKKLIKQHIPGIQGAPRLPGRDGWLYFLKRADGVIWIGFSANPKDPKATVVPGSREIEMMLHQHFAEDLVEDKWFLPGKELTDLIAHLKVFAGNFWHGPAASH